ITNSTLYTAGSFDFETKNSYSIRVRSTDQTSLFFEKVFTVTVTNVNEPPATPVNLSPANGAELQPSAVVLQSSSFSDPDSGDTQAASQWIVRRSTDSAVVFDSGTDVSDTTNIALAPDLLDFGTSYAWQVRYQDSHSAWSPYSASTGFSTIGPTVTVSGSTG